MAKPESEFPTITDARDALQTLVDRGFGELPVQMVIVPASTLFLLAKDAGYVGSKHALMLEMTASDGADLGLLIASVETLRETSGRLM